MGMFDNILHADQTLFKNVEALGFEFMPKIIPYRESQQRRIAAAIQPLFADRNGKNLVIHGLPGVGKTVACKKVLDELEEKTEDITAIYINCWQKNTSYKVILDICDGLGYAFTQNKKTDELFKEVLKLLNKRKVVFVFDEIDKAEDYDFLYSILEEVYRKAIILITNYKSFMEDLDERVKSRLMPELIEFRPYSLDDTRGIMKQRVDAAFFANVWETDAFEIITKKTAALQDIRMGIQLLKEAGDAAEAKASKRITLQNAQEALAKNDDLSALKSTDLDDEDKVMLSIIKKNSGQKIGDLFKLYAEAGGKTAYKTFQRRMKAFEEQGFVTCTKSQGEGGNTTIIQYKERPMRLSDFN